MNNPEEYSNNISNPGTWFEKNKAEIIDWMKYIITAFLLAFLLSNYVIVNAYVPTESMADTINPKTRLIANRLNYLLDAPKRGDIVVFRFPDDEKTLYVKRIIGLPGETVEVKDGSVYIDGNKLEEPYIKQKIFNEFGPYKIPENKYFMMGDNRNNSWDSRFWTNKGVDRKKILGKVLMEYFPTIKFFGT